ncbi:2819_t:CDS:2 [Acaulospora colombiana]|uniref:2819_t:CDS:1 n=1 Tax=Acaulospora colombiana TaxID=27376 RepID=A0ACA9K7N5_9GLOM|nr:2819_t:CDS:2 [Acaulospora colombiana]
MTNTIKLGGKEVPVTTSQSDINVASVFEFKPFKEWASAMSEEFLNAENKEIEVRKVEIQNVDFFGSKIGFIKFKVDAVLTENGKNVPGIVFMRGGSVAVLLILRSKDQDNETVKEHVVLTYQPRIPVPSLSFPEIPAGIEENASVEIKEETGIEINDQDLIDMTELAYGRDYKGAYPSCGACDEFLRLCLCIKEMNREDIEKLEGKLCGLRDHGESITVRLIELKDLWRIPDMKALSSLALYDALKRNEKI